MKRILKIVAWILGIATGAFVGILILALVYLPSPAEMGASLGFRAPVSETLNREKSNANPTKSNALSREEKIAVSPTITNGTSDSRMPHESRAATANSAVDAATKLSQRLHDQRLQSTIEAVLDDSPLPDFCGEMMKAHTPLSNAAEAQSLLDSNNRQELKNHPGWQAMAGPLRSLLSGPRTRQLTAELAQSERTSLFSKAQFYGLLLGAIQEAEARKVEVERMSRDYYMMYVLSQIAAKNPSFAAREEFSSVCGNLQTQLSQPSNSQTSSSPSLDAKRIQALIQEAGLTPENVGFSNENLRATVTAKNRDGEVSLKLSTPWVDTILE